MSRHESVEKSIYDELEGLSQNAFDLYLWSFINPRCNLAGLYPVSARAMLESKVPQRSLKGALSELSDERHLFFVEGLVWVKSRIKRLPTRGPKIAQPIFRDVCKVDARHPLRIALIFHYTQELQGRGEDFEWLAPLLRTLDVVPYKGEDPIPEYDSSDESSTTADESVWSGTSRTAAFQDWLEDHARTTGIAAPKAGTKALVSLVAAFDARVAEGYSPTDLKLATVGAYNDQFRRENGYFTAESVLRPTKVHDLIEKGRRGNVRQMSSVHQRLEDMRRRATEPEGGDAA